MQLNRMIRFSFAALVLMFSFACSNPPAEVKAQSDRPGKGPNDPTIPTEKPESDGATTSGGRIFCVRGQVKSSLASFSTNAAPDVFATSLVFKKRDFPLVDLNDFELISRSNEQLEFVIIGEETNPSETSDVSKKVSAHLISSRLLSRSSEILETLPIVEHPADRVATLESQGYRLNRILLDDQSSLKVYGPNKLVWEVEVGGKTLVSLPASEYFGPRLIGKSLFFFKLESGLVNLVKIDLNKPEVLQSMSADSKLGSIMSYAQSTEGLVLLQKVKDQYSLSHLNETGKQSVVASWESSGRAWMNSDEDRIYLITEEGNKSLALAQWDRNTLLRLGHFLVDGEVKDVLSFNQNHYAIIKDKGVNRIYKISSAEKQKVISRSECERAWILKW